MANPWDHAKSSVRQYGGKPDDYLPVHKWFDATKLAWADPRHRAVLHSAFGIGLAEQVFGQVLVRPDATDTLVQERTELLQRLKQIDDELIAQRRAIPTRYIGEQHVREDLGFIPSIETWLSGLPTIPWMLKGPRAFSRTVRVNE
jgi:hypothetical protein